MVLLVALNKKLDIYACVGSMIHWRQSDANEVCMSGKPDYHASHQCSEITHGICTAQPLHSCL
jgi:hypothetical protein